MSRVRFVAVPLVFLVLAACSSGGTATRPTHSNQSASPTAGAATASPGTDQLTPVGGVQATPTPVGGVQPTSPPVSGADFSSPWPAGATVAVYDAPTFLTSSVHVVFVVGITGSVAKVLAKVTLARRTQGGRGAPIEPPYVSTTQSKVYVLDGDTTVKAIASDGSIKQVASLGASASVRASFAVSPDDARIAIGQFDNASRNANIVYVEKLGGGSRVDVLTATTPPFYLPVAWHAGKIVLSTGRGNTASAFNPYDALGYALVDPAAGATPVLLGNGDCQPSGLIVAAGTACISAPNSKCIGALVAGATSPYYYNSCLRRIDWSGKETVFLFSSSPYDASLVVNYAALTQDGTAIWIDNLGRLEQPVSATHGGNDFLQGYSIITPRKPCMGWIDGTHFSFTQVYPDATERVRITDVSFEGVQDAGPGLPGSPVTGQLMGTVPESI